MDCTWALWENWSECLKLCGDENHSRTRGLIPGNEEGLSCDELQEKEPTAHEQRRKCDIMSCADCKLKNAMGRIAIKGLATLSTHHT